MGMPHQVGGFKKYSGGKPPPPLGWAV